MVQVRLACSAMHPSVCVGKATMASASMVLLLMGEVVYLDQNAQLRFSWCHKKRECRFHPLWQ